MEYSKNAQTVYRNLYLARNNEDVIIESIKQCHERVARFLSINEKEQEEFYNILQEKRFRPNTPAMTNASINSDHSLLACFLLGLEDSMESIIEMWATVAKIYAGGGGAGIPITNLRPAKANISSGGQASGPLSYAKVIQSISDQVRSGGRVRRAANILSFWYKHKDIFDLVKMKSGNDDFSAINISVLVDNLFMKTGRNEDRKDLWIEIITQAWKTGDPGLIFFDTVNKDNPFPSLGDIVTSNPCLPPDTLLLDNNKLLRIDSSDAKTWTSWKTGIKEVVEIETNIGLKIRCTGDHLLRLDDGSFVEAEKSIGKKLYHPVNFIHYKRKKRRDRSKILEGFLFGDGFICGCGCGVGVGLNKEKEKEIYNLLIDFGFKEIKGDAYYINLNQLSSKIDCSFLGKPCIEKVIPDSILNSSRNVLCDFMAGLFEANGFCNKSAGQISFKTISKNLAEQIQIILLSFGVHASISENKPLKVKWPNGEYTSKKSYNIQVSPSQAVKFKETIGFYSEYKNEQIKIDEISNRSTIIPTSLKSLGEQEVWDFKMKEGPSYNFGQGIILHNCSEIMGPPWTACVLGHLNVKHYFKAGQFETDDFERDIEIAVRFLNRIIDKTSYPNPKFRDTMQITRPIGLGLMGFADVLYKLRIPYGSDDSIDLFDNLTKHLTKHAFESSIFLAENGGISVKCPKEDEKHFLELQERFGVEKPFLNIANSTVTCLAPTGSTAISADCCYSFEPMFSLIWSKKLTDRDETLYFVNEEFKSYCQNRGIELTDNLKQKISENNGSIKGLREFNKIAQSIFTTAHDIHWKNRLKMQAAGQRNISMSISSTVNLPNNATVKEVQEVYYGAWEMGLKGVTVYRDGSKENQPVNFGSKTKKDEVDIEIVEMMVKELMEEGSSSWASDVYEKEKYLADLIIGMIGKYCPSATLEETESAPIRERPQELFGKTIKMKTGSGELYLTINELDGVPFEVFATIGKGGRSISAKAEAIGRLVSLCLRAGVRVKEIVKQLDGIGGDYPIFQEGRLIKSIPDAIATVLRSYENEKERDDPVKDIMEMKEDIKNQTGLENIPIKKTLEETIKNSWSWTPETDLFESIKKSEKEYKKALEFHAKRDSLPRQDVMDTMGEAVLPDSGSICPQCGQPTLSYIGCRGGMCKNPECGFSNCS